MQTTLDLLKVGESATVVDIDIDTVPLKLVEMGCLPGNPIRILQIAPFGDPLYLEVNGAHLAIRVETARQILVEKSAL
ncbi:MAG TPA: FeoA family protein [Flavobacterium sp.]|nr:FeoA family protein [Flavobacterium sp.]